VATCCYYYYHYYYYHYYYYYSLVTLVETTVHWSSIIQQVKRPNKMASITRKTTMRFPLATYNKRYHSQLKTRHIRNSGVEEKGGRGRRREGGVTMMMMMIDDDDD